MEDRIKVYSSMTCPKCKMLKMQLQKYGITYEEIHDVDYMTSIGIQSVPVLEVNDQRFSLTEAIQWIKERANA